MPDITTGLVAHWKLDEGSGTTFVDHSGNGYSPAFVGAPSWITGHIGAGALQLDGVDDAAEFFTGPALANSSFTFAGWFYVSAYDSTPISIGSSASGNNCAQISFWSSNRIYFGFYANDLATDNDVFSLNTWHHVVGVYDYSAGSRSIYVDGVRVAHQSSGVTAFQGDTSCRIGSAAVYGGAYEYYEGRLDELRVYTRALSAEDVEALYEYTGAPAEATITAAFTEPNETLSATATHPVTGVAAFTEPNETLNAAASHPVTGSATFTEPNETLSSAATVQWFANAAFTEPNETLTSAAAVAVAATALSAAEPNETLSGAVGVLNTLAGAFTEPNESLSSDVETTVIRTITAAFTEPNETLSGAAGVTVTGSLTATEPNETLACAAAVAVVAAADFTEPNETLSAAAGGATLLVGEFTEPDETLSAQAVVLVSATLAAAEANETLSAAATHPVTGALNATEPSETLSSAAGVAIVLSFDATEPNEQVSSMVDTGVGFRRRGERHVSIGLRVGL